METRDAYLAQAGRLLRKENFTKEDKSKVDSLFAMAEQVGPVAMQLKRAKMDAAELSLGTHRTREDVSDANTEKQFRQYLIHGYKSLEPEARAQSVSSDGGGGYLVPASFRTTLEVALKAINGLYAAAGEWLSTTGRATVVPILDDTSQSASTVAENSLSATNVDVPFEGISFGTTPTWRSGHVRVSRELVSDSYYDINTMLASAFAVRLSRGIGAALVGVLKAGADVGVTSASPTAVTMDEVLSLMGSVDAAYAANGTFCMSYGTYIKLLQLKNTNAQYYINPDAPVDSDGFPTLWGRRVYFCNNYDATVALAKPISFGDHSKLLVRKVVGSLEVKQYDERYAEYLQLAYESFWRVDSGFLKPAAYGSPAISQSPVMFLAMHS